MNHALAIFLLLAWSALCFISGAMLQQTDAPDCERCTRKQAPDVE